MAKRVINFRYDEEDWARVAEYANEHGLTVTDLVRGYLDNLIGKDNNNDVVFTKDSQPSSRETTKQIKKCKDSIDSFKSEFTNNHNQTIDKLEGKIEVLQQENIDLFKKVNKLSLDSSNKDNLISQLTNKFEKMMSRIEKIEIASLSLQDLKAVAKINEISYPSNINKQKLVDLLIAQNAFK